MIVSWSDLLAVLPAILVALTAIAVLLSGAFLGAVKAGCRNLTTAGIGAALALLIFSPPQGNLGGSIVGGAYSAFVQAAVLVVAILAVWLAAARLEDDEVKPHEFFTLMLFSVVGMLGLGTAAEAISLFVAL